MKIKPILADMSGRLQGIVASHNRGGQYFRGRTVPNNPSTGPQTAARVAMTNAVNAWTATLTEDQRLAWNAYALSNPQTDGFGDPVNIGGIGWFVRTNSARIYASLPIVEDAPILSGPAAFTLSEPVFTYAAGDIDVAFDNTDAWAAADGGALLVFTSGQQSVTRYSSRGIPLRLAAVILGDTGTPPTSPETVTPWGPFPAGTRMFVKAYALAADGRRSAPYETFLDG